MIFHLKAESAASSLIPSSDEAQRKRPRTEIFVLESLRKFYISVRHMIRFMKFPEKKDGLRRSKYTPNIDVY